MSQFVRPAVEDLPPPAALLRIVNPVLRTVLQSPLHRALSSGLMLLHVTGRKSGRVYLFPVGRYELDGQLLGCLRRRRLEAQPGRRRQPLGNARRAPASRSRRPGRRPPRDRRHLQRPLGSTRLEAGKPTGLETQRRPIPDRGRAAGCAREPQGPPPQPARHRTSSRIVACTSRCGAARSTCTVRQRGGRRPPGRRTNQGSPRL